MLFARGPSFGLRLIFLVLLSIVLMVLDHRQHMLGRMRNGLSLLTAPVEYAVSWPFGFFDKLADGFTSHQELVEENTDLRAQQLILLGQLQKLQALQQENQQLRALLQSSANSNSERLLAAQILSVNMGPFVEEMIVNKGSNDSVYVGQAVIDATGIMGQIIDVTPWTSRLLLITDPRSAIPVRDNRNGLYGIVDGRGDQQNLTWVNMPVTVDVRVGDVLVSSGLGGHYPVGYPVGTVVSVLHNPDEQFATITVVPAAQISSSEHVLLVWPANDKTTNNSNPQSHIKISMNEFILGHHDKQKNVGTVQ